MKTNSLLCITTVAIATAALTVATFGGGSMEAGDESAAAGSRISQPKLTICGVEMSLAAADAKVFHAGDQPTFELKAVNTSDQPADVKVAVTLTASSPTSMFSRVMRLPATLWTTTQSLKLNGKEARTVSLGVTTNLPANNLFSVRLADATSEPATVAGRPVYMERGIVGLSFSTVTNMNVSVVSQQNQAAFAAVTGR